MHMASVIVPITFDLYSCTLTRAYTSHEVPCLVVAAEMELYHLRRKVILSDLKRYLSPQLQIWWRISRTSVVPVAKPLDDTRLDQEPVTYL